MSKENQILITNNMTKMNVEEINEMFNSGMFNEIVKGFIAMVMVENGYSNGVVRKMISNLACILDEVTAKEARDFYKNL
jgi:hypothetical protein